jgi:hypothetical protein
MGVGTLILIVAIVITDTVIATLIIAAAPLIAGTIVSLGAFWVFILLRRRSEGDKSQ